ncbi:ABC transporter substrate-binding protein [bacterium]|nr:MAG: ABC transporter substrate-binding protein [bacterium]
MKLWLRGLLMMLATTACAEPVPVAVSIAPQAWLVERLGGSLVTVVTAMAPGESPHSFDPTPRHVARLSGALVYFAVGVPMENQLLPRLESTCPEMKIVDTTADIPRLAEADMDEHAGHEHQDPHVWLDPHLLKIQALVMVETLCRQDPRHTQRYLAAAAELTVELDTLHEQMATILAPVRGRELFVLHPAFGYLASAYGLRQVSLEPAQGDPSPRQLAEVLDHLAASGARAVFTQPQVSMSAARAVAREAQVELVVLDPLAADVDANLLRMALAIREALHGE